jgi:hypothetical protein
MWRAGTARRGNVPRSAPRVNSFVPADAIDRERKARAEGYHAAPERVPILRFDDEMRAIAL